MTARNKKAYFLVSGEIEYRDGEGDSFKTMRVNGIHSGERYLIVKDLAKIQTMLQMQFHHKNQRRSPNPPEITDAVIYSVTFLGEFTHEEFHAGAPVPPSE